eukprot:scpid64064/ scgid22336/ 
MDSRARLHAIRASLTRSWLENQVDDQPQPEGDHYPFCSLSSKWKRVVLSLQQRCHTQFLAVFLRCDGLLFKVLGLASVLSTMGMGTSNEVCQPCVTHIAT